MYLLKLLRKILVFFIIIIIAYFYNRDQIKNFREIDLKLNSKKILNTIKITQISDFHSNDRINLQRLGEHILQFDPHFIVLTGDIIDRYDDNLHTSIQLIETLCSLNIPIYYIMGNHEADNILYEDFKNQMLSKNVIVLEDDSSTIELDGNMVNIVGLGYSSDTDINFNYQGIVNNLNLNYYNLLLVHSPNSVENLVRGSEDLILSGHTHGGQIRIPLIGPIIAPGQGIFPKLDKGLYEINNSILYIDSGLGNSFFSIRLLNPVQFTNITIEPS